MEYILHIELFYNSIEFIVFLTTLHKNLVWAAAPEHIIQQWSFNYNILRYSKLLIVEPEDVFESAAKIIPF